MELIIAVALVLLFFGAIMFGLSFAVAKVTDVIFRSKNKEFSKKQFWQTVAISMLICLLISGMICGGVL